jgi:hypothetical protein
MSTPINDGGPAFPGLHPSKECHYQDSGMTLRDYFAAQALAGICASGPSEYWTDKHITAETYRLADAMLAARQEVTK